MNRLLTVGGVAAGFLVIAHALAEESREENMKEQRPIPLSEIVTTSPQKGLQQVRDALQQENAALKSEATDGYLRQIQSISNGSSNAFLVDAINTSDSIAASLSILVGWRSANTPAPVNTTKPKRGSHWLVAYLGSGPSTPTWWNVESVSATKSTVTLTYKRSKPSPATADVHPYFYWVPLGKLDPGPYEVQLLDADRGVISLMRRVEVEVNTEKGIAP